MNDTFSSRNAETPPMGLRERKKRLVQTTIEETALQLFQQQGYERTSIQDIADAVMMSTRTFFRYFASKEEVLFGPTHAALDASIDFLRQMMPVDSPHVALRATFLHLAGLYQQQRDNFLMRYRVAVQTPSIASAYIYALLEREPVISDALCSRLGANADRQKIHALVALYMTALRLALELWLARDAQGDLGACFSEHLDYFLSFSHQI